MSPNPYLPDQRNKQHGVVSLFDQLSEVEALCELTPRTCQHGCTELSGNLKPFWVVRTPKGWIDTSSAAQGGGGSFQHTKPIGEVGCCESRMAERIH